MTNEQILILVLVALIVGAGAFLLGKRSGNRSLPTAKEQRIPGQAGVSQAQERENLDEQRERQVAAPLEVQAATRPGVEEAVAATSWLSRLSTGLSKTQQHLVRQLDSLFTSTADKASREAILDGMLEILVRADVGIRTAESLIEKVRHELPGDDLSDAQAVKGVLRKEILRMLSVDKQWSLVPEGNTGTPTVVLMVGVNGVGKTTTTGKLAFKERQAGKSVIVGAADTFRAAAVDQLEEWAKRAGAECVRLTEGADPASVAFECVKRAVTQQTQLCLIDTAGRLHNRQDLMQELGKIRRVASKDVPGAPHEVLLVLDATTGQNALQQAKSFREVAGVTGLVLTKLDGTAKGGVAIALASELGLPIRYIGVGESVDDLQLFKADEFVDALFTPGHSATQEQTMLRGLPGKEQPKGFS
ncbi:MAG: signal recognition particle-docking protein FtsY [Silvanigrellaceae bacterium]